MPVRNVIHNLVLFATSPRTPARLGLTLLLLSVTLLSCGSDAPILSDLERGREYLDSESARRAALEESLVKHDNDYSSRRLERYRADEWGQLPIWNPPTHPVVTEDIGGDDPEPTGEWQAIQNDGVAWTEEALIELGRQAFHAYPMQIEPAMRQSLSDPTGPEEYGLWRAGDQIGGLVWVELADGVEPAVTCSTCHGSPDDGGGLRSGLTNASFDYGRVLDDYYRRVSESGRWGPGRTDVTPDEEENPTTIPDLRAVRFQTHLNRAATLRNDLIALAIRLETGMITANGEVVRPPREITFAVALYLWSLGTELPEPGTGPGREIFEEECGSCHQAPGLSGPPTALSEVGTDPTIGESPARTTGYYQSTSLRGVSDRALFLANGAVRDLEAFLDPAREAPGHRYGDSLSPEARDLLLAFLESL